MPPVQQTAGKLKIDVEGTEIPADVDNLLYSATVDDNLNQPDLFVLIFRDADRVVLKKTGAKIGSKVTITAFSDASSGGEKLLTGEVTALEVEHDGTGTFTVIRGYDRSHRLFRGRTTASYQNVTYGDVVKKVALRAGLDAGRVDAGGSVHSVVSQPNLSDWQFLQSLARDVGYQVAVVDGKLDFRLPAKSSDGPGSADLRAVGGPLELTMGAHILRLRTVITAAEQVPEVEVRGWDPKQKRAVVSSAPAKSDTATLSLTPASVANEFSSPKLVGTSTPVQHAGGGRRRGQGHGRSRGQRLGRSGRVGPGQSEAEGGDANQHQPVRRPIRWQVHTDLDTSHLQLAGWVHDRLHRERTQSAITSGFGLGRFRAAGARRRGHPPWRAWCRPWSPT